MDKAQWRAHFKGLRESIPAAERQRADDAICAHLTSLEEYAACDAVFAYLSFGAEIETRRIIQHAWEAGKTVAIPRSDIRTRMMTWYVIDSFDDLEKSPLGPEEPVENTEKEVTPRVFEKPLCLVPGLSFDARGYRMGYGGGFYDLFLADFTGVSVGLCRAQQFSDVIPALQPHDLPVDIVVSDIGVQRV